MPAAPHRPKLIFLDTCVLLEDPQVLDRVRRKNGQPVISDTVLRELDRFKSGGDGRATNARETFRRLGTRSRPLNYLDAATPVKDGDIATLFEENGGSIIVINRSNHGVGATNDDKIIDVASSYGMLLLSRDRAMIIRAQANGADAVFWNHASKPRQSSNPSVPPFKLLPHPSNTNAVVLPPVSNLSSGDSVVQGNGVPLELRERIGGGGEGTIFATSDPGQVAKIYDPSRITSEKRAKIELMLTRQLERDGISWPTSLLCNVNGNFVGYLMPRADGRPMQSTMFVRPVLERTYPAWKRSDLVNVAIAFAEHMEFLHELNIVVGDINPMNLLAQEDSTKVAIVDTDSFQIEGYPCPVGTVNFTPAHRQGQAYTEYLRTKDDELFAVATMIFMILHPGKPPYAQQGGGSPGENIRKKEFAYWFKTKEGEVHTAEKAPEGPWQTIWANLPWGIRGAFHETFREDRRVSVTRWLQLLRRYRSELANGRHSNELFPRSFPIRDPFQVDCSSCGQVFVGSRSQIAKRQAKGFDPWCPKCFEASRLRKLARQSREASAANTRSVVGRQKYATSGRTYANPASRRPMQTKTSTYSASTGGGTSGGGMLALIGAGIAALIGIFG